MQKIIQRHQNIIKTICKPSPKLSTDPASRQTIYKRNIISLYGGFLFCMVYTIFSMFYASSSVSLYILGGSSWLLCSFMLLCRSHPYVFNVMCVSVSMLVGFQSLDLVQEATYFYLGFTFVLLPFIMRISGDINLTLLCGIVQILVLMTKFKEKLRILVRAEEPEIFVEKFVNLFVVFFWIRLLINWDLLRALHERTAELSKAKSATENALEQQKTFVFSFSHELRNPINSLLGNLQLVLQCETLSTKAAEMIKVAKVCGELLLRNINNVLDTGKHEIGKLEVNPVETQLHELFQKTWSIYCELLRQKKLKSSLRIEKILPSVVKIDAHKLNQILLNLIGNAIKFTEKGSVSVNIKWLKSCEVCEKSFHPVPYDDIDEGIFEKEENISRIDTNPCSLSQFSKPDLETYNDEYEDQEPQGVIKIIVKDSGPGMKKESLEKLFKKFSQVSENASHRQIGTGLGLYITKELCAAMGGEIRAYSKPGAGSVFVVCIPATIIPPENSEKNDSTSAIDELAEKHINALVADGCPFNENLAKDYLSKFGASVTSVVYNGFDAFAMYKKCRMANVQLDMVLLDIKLTVMGTRTVCDRIREFERENGLKPVMIVLMTGNYDQEEIIEYLNHHQVNGYLRKPISFSEFSKAIYSIVTFTNEGQDDVS